MLATIVTPAYNSANFLEDNINSVLIQLQNHEHIVIDGGSTDGSLSLLSKYSSTLAYWISEQDSGQSEAINKGLSVARGDFINWINSDDYLLPGALEVVSSIFEKYPTVDIVCGRSLLVSSDKTTLKTIYQRTGRSFLYCYAGMVFPQPSAFFRSSVLHRVGHLNENLAYGMDYEFILRILLTGGHIYQTNKCLSAYRLHPHSKTSTNSFGFAEDWIQVFNDFLQDEDHGQYFVDILRSLNLHRPKVLSYERTKCFTQRELKTVFLKSLHYQFAYRAIAGDLPTARHIAKYLLLNSVPSRNSLAYLKKTILTSSV